MNCGEASGTCGVASVAARAKDEHGFTLIELVATMAILGTVLASITAVLASSTRLESNLNLASRLSRTRGWH